MEAGLRNRSLSGRSDVEFVCSGEFCRSCSTGIIADCVAVSCCPCAVINLFVFALAKLPWLVGRRVMRRLQKKLHKRRIKEEKEVEKSEEKSGGGGGGGGGGDDGGGGGGGGTLEGLKDFEIICGGFEAERALMELYQVSHLGFGRLSFTGIQVKS